MQETAQKFLPVPNYMRRYSIKVGNKRENYLFFKKLWKE